MIYIVIIELISKNKKNEILTEVYSNKQEAKLTYNVIVRSLLSNSNQLNVHG